MVKVRVRDGLGIKLGLGFWVMVRTFGMADRSHSMLFISLCSISIGMVPVWMGVTKHRTSPKYMVSIHYKKRSDRYESILEVD